MGKDNTNKIKRFLNNIGTISSNCENAIRFWEEKDKKERLVRENLARLRTQADQMYKTYSEIQSHKLYEKDPRIIDNINEFEPEISGIVDYSKMCPHTAKSTRDATITPIILFRYRLPPHIRRIIPIKNPNKPIIEPSAIKYSIPPKISSK